MGEHHDDEDRERDDFLHDEEETADVDIDVRGLSTDEYRQVLVKLMQENLRRQRRVCRTLYGRGGVVLQLRDVMSWLNPRKRMERVIVNTIVIALTSIALLMLAKAMVEGQHK